MHYFRSTYDASPVKPRQAAKYRCKLVAKKRFFLGCNCTNRLDQFCVTFLGSCLITYILVLIDEPFVRHLLLATSIVHWQETAIPVSNTSTTEWRRPRMRAYRTTLVCLTRLHSYTYLSVSNLDISMRLCLIIT